MKFNPTGLEDLLRVKRQSAEFGESEFGDLVKSMYRQMIEQIDAQLGGETNGENIHRHNFLKGQRAALSFMLDDALGVGEQIDDMIEAAKANIKADEELAKKYPHDFKAMMKEGQQGLGLEPIKWGHPLG